ncbi:zinc-ribbon domain-containing protein [Paracoccus sp. M683]|uniref:zinc-ribbon domain-containing protein n=1 Tax=Paracoccus sp. M683 TaxID=2594268 RepID=UPI00163D8869|nr:zinc-ribbon domain-containing protein [Paracoccus sp. M683]
MSEIRLTCPKCGTEYRLPEDAIPVAGRNVECSTCGQVWHQPGIAAGTTRGDSNQRPDDSEPTPMPRLNRQLSDSVLSVLREEAALARRQRAADTETDTTVPDAVVTRETGTAAVATLALDATAAGPAPSRHINASPQRPAPDAPQHEAMEATVNRTTPHGATDGRSTRDAARAYMRGLCWSAGIAAALLLLYVAAPRMADQGAAGMQLMEWRISLDDGRVWLQDRLLGGPTE